ncbi:hypothetical protein U8527_04355 [Kordia algicida OT-1]|uniref:Uncharacterized protein n=1 Tax=Kordia algicida OT-1 TaxID=391587 RepID=A9DPY1_9FLAO|nr:hypothetical protein [Kordia algicida]EDP97554.1 hypothetical protein KAOT1_20367 [Kordia algicida OT-1]
MVGKQRHITQLLKQLPFLLVLCALLAQPIVKTYSLLSADTSYEFVDYDVEDDTEEEAEDTLEEDEKVTPYSINFLFAETDIALYNAHFYVQKSCIPYNTEIFIPPPELV